MALTDNLISYWKLDEASGDAVDAHGASTLTDHGSVGTAVGKINTARDFGTGSSTKYFSHADSTDLSTGDIDCTFAAWVYLSARTKSYPAVLGKASSDEGQIEYQLLYRNSQNAFEWNFNGAVVRATNFGIPATSTWYHVVCWHDAANNQVGISVNAGTPNTAADAGGTDTVRGFALGTLGEYVDSSSTWDGLLDEVGFWKRVLTAQERTDLYNGGNGLAYPFSTGTIYYLAAGTGGYTLAGGGAALAITRVLPGTAGSFALAGGAAGLTTSRVLVGGTGAYALAGRAAFFPTGRVLTGAAGVFALAGGAAAFSRFQSLAGGVGVYSLAGGGAGFKRDWSALGGTFTLTGGEAGFRLMRRAAGGGVPLFGWFRRKPKAKTKGGPAADLHQAARNREMDLAAALWLLEDD